MLGECQEKITCADASKDRKRNTHTPYPQDTPCDRLDTRCHIGTRSGSIHHDSGRRIPQGDTRERRGRPQGASFGPFGNLLNRSNGRNLAFPRFMDQRRKESICIANPALFDLRQHVAGPYMAQP